MKVFLIGNIICLVSIFGLLVEKVHLLIVFLIIEIFFLGGFIIVKEALEEIIACNLILIYYLTIGVVERVMGLAILIRYYRLAGEEYFISNSYA